MLTLCFRAVYENSSDTVVQDIHGLLQEQRNLHIQRFMEAENYLNQAFDISVQLDQFVTERDAIIDQENVSPKKKDGFKYVKISE
jgi:hypothetical protein